MNTARRKLLLQAGGAATVLALNQAQAASGLPPRFDPVPTLPTQPTPGRPGDFDFLNGEWRIEHFRQLPGRRDRDHFEGEATCWSLLGGRGSVEELRIPARQFSGMGLRLLDAEKAQWSDFWVNAKSGVLSTPGQTGSFEQGVGIFASDYEEEGRKMISAGLWDQIGPRSCRWRQVVSADGGKSWEHNWVMHWRRV